TTTDNETPIEIDPEAEIIIIGITIIIIKIEVIQEIGITEMTEMTIALEAAIDHLTYHGDLQSHPLALL
ncbi:83_t:CDS:1, partial [Gigaspora margarita]